MIVTLNLAPETERRLKEEAALSGITLAAYLQRLVEREVSQMPKNLFDGLSAEQIMDLVAYVTSGGDEKSKLFQGGHDHHH